MTKTSSYMDFPADLPMRRVVLEKLYEGCDVFHARNGFEEYDRLAAKYGPKPVVALFHGTRFRANPALWVEECRKRGAKLLVSTLDLWMLAPEDAEWFPSVQNIAALEAMR